MKAIVTVINDYGEVVEKDKVIEPFDEYITSNPKDIVKTKTTIFKFSIFSIIEPLNLDQIMDMFTPSMKKEEVEE